MMYRLVVSLLFFTSCSTLWAASLPGDSTQSTSTVVNSTEISRYGPVDWQSVSSDVNRKEEPSPGIFAFLASLPRLAIGVNNTWFDSSTADTPTSFSRFISATPVETMRVLAARINESQFKWDFTRGTGSFDIKAPLASGSWTVESLAGSDTSGRYRLGLQASRKIGSVGTSLAWRYHGSGLWGTDTGQWNELLLALTLAQWKLDSQLRLDDAQQKLRFALAWNDGRWTASAFHSTLMNEDISHQYGIAWARHITFWRFATTLGLQWATGTDGEENLSPWLQLAVPLGAFRLEWKLKYDDVLSGYSDRPHQTIILSISQPLP